MSWLWLVLAICLEVFGTVSMKLSAGFTKLTPAVLMFVFYGLSLSSLTMALKRIDVSVAYAVWSGLGTALITAIGIIYLREPLTAIKAGAVGLIIVGVVLLNVYGNAH
jgi:small multidrug resistance pump